MLFLSKLTNSWSLEKRNQRVSFSSAGCNPFLKHSGAANVMVIRGALLVDKQVNAIDEIFTHGIVREPLSI
jgi:hypothetical protein